MTYCTCLLGVGNGARSYRQTGAKSNTVKLYISRIMAICLALPPTPHKDTSILFGDTLISVVRASVTDKAENAMKLGVELDVLVFFSSAGLASVQDLRRASRFFMLHNCMLSAERGNISNRTERTDASDITIPRIDAVKRSNKKCTTVLSMVKVAQRLDCRTWQRNKRKLQLEHVGYSKPHHTICRHVSRGARKRMKLTQSLRQFQFQGVMLHGLRQWIGQNRMSIRMTTTANLSLKLAVAF